MDCPACGHDNSAGARFCGECGERLAEASVCPGCGASNAVEQRFCNGCGRPLSAADTDQPLPRSYTPPHLAEKILASRGSLEGERKQVTVLFADVQGSMALSEDADTEAWHAVMDRFFAILCEGVHRFEGTVTQFTGDGIMALFGAPIAHEDHARRACYSAMQLVTELGRYAEELRRSRGMNFHTRIGLHSGEVVVGAIGKDLQMDYTAIGHTVGLARRMEELAAADRAYVTEDTASLVAGFFELRDLGEFAIKGARDAVHVYELSGTGPLRTRLDVSRARGFSRFVGRDGEMGILEQALAQALEGNAQVVGLVGDAGVGKSRLCYEFAQGCRTRGLIVREAHGVAHGKTVPFLPVLELFRGFFGIGERDTDEQARQKIAGTMLLLDPELTAALPLLFDFLGVSDPEQPAPLADPEVRQRQLYGVIKRIVHARSRRQPAILLFEDLHWVDAGSEGFLENIIESVPGTRTLIIANFRPEYHAGWMQRSYYQQRPLMPLGEDATDELLRDVLGADPSLAGLAGRIRERARGNPFFVEEIVQSLVQSRHLEGVRGAWRLTRAVDELAIPATVEAVLAARIDRLPERDKAVLQTASVIGEEFSQPVLQRVGEWPRDDLAASLDRLVQGEFVYEQALYPEAEYAFKHPLTQEVSYTSQLAERRTRVHAAVARAIPELDPERLDERSALVAQHWERAGEAAEAANWCARAARWVAANDPGDALRLWRKARTLLGQIPESAETIALGLEACGQVMTWGLRMGIPDEEAAGAYEEGRALAERIGDRRTVALLVARYASVRGMAAGDLAALREGSLEAARLAQEVGDPELQLLISLGLVLSHLYSGALREALAFAGEALSRAPEDPGLGRELNAGMSPRIWLVCFQGVGLLLAGKVPEARREIERAMELARDHADVGNLGFAYGSRALVAAFAGDEAAALADARQAIDIAERTGNLLAKALSYRTLGMAHLQAEHWAEAREALERALEVTRENRILVLNEGQVLARLAEALLGSGEVRKARATAEEALTLTKRQGALLLELDALVSLARVLRRTEGAASEGAVRAALNRALSLVEQTGIAFDEAIVREELAELARVTGDDAGRARELREAHRLYLTMGAPARAARLEPLPVSPDDLAISSLDERSRSAGRAPGTSSP